MIIKTLKNLRIIFLVAFFLWCASIGICDNDAQAVETEPLKITASEMKIFRENQTVEFSGNVVAIQGEMKLSSDLMIINYQLSQEKGKKGEIRNISHINAKDNVQFFYKNITASGDRGYYDIKKEIIEVMGNVVLREDGSVVKGNKFTHNVKNNQSIMRGNNKRTGTDGTGRVTVILDDVENEINKK